MMSHPPRSLRTSKCEASRGQASGAEEHLERGTAVAKLQQTTILHNDSDGDQLANTGGWPKADIQLQRERRNSVSGDERWM